jgi:hypothetical protein
MSDQSAGTQRPNHRNLISQRISTRIPRWAKTEAIRAGRNRAREVASRLRLR